MQKLDGDLEPSQELTEAGRQQGGGESQKFRGWWSKLVCFGGFFFSFAFYFIKHKDQPFEQLCFFFKSQV